MTIKNHIATVTEILATASIVGIGLAVGGPIGASVVAAIGIELSGNILDNHLSKLKEKWLSSPDGILNHDIQQAMVRAFIKSLDSLEKKYFALEEVNEIPKEKKKAIKSLFQELKDEAPTIFLSSVETSVSEQEIKTYLYDKPQEARNLLGKRIEETNLIYTYYGEHFKIFLRDNCLDEIVFWFGEELKTDNKENNKAWRAFQRLLLEGIQADVKAVQASQNAIQQDLQTLSVIREQLDQIKDTIDHRLPNEPFQRELEKLASETKESACPSKGLSDDQLRLLLRVYVNEWKLNIYSSGYEYECLRTGPIGQYWGFEYTPMAIELTRYERSPKQNPPGARIERLRWLGAFEELKRRSLVESISERIYVLSAEGKKLNRTTGDWHRGALADTSRVVTPLKQSVRSFCADNDDSGYSPCRASPHAGRIAPRPLWLPVGAAPPAPVCRRPHAQRGRRRTLLLALKRVSGGSGVPGGDTLLRRPERRRYQAETVAEPDALPQALRDGPPQDPTPRLWVVSHAVELCRVGLGGTSTAGD
jgi:hypothetical protein